MAVNLADRYYLFVFGDYYPSGGLNDLHFTSNNLQEVKREIDRLKTTAMFTGGWGHIQLLDTVENLRITKQSLNRTFKGDK